MSGWQRNWKMNFGMNGLEQAEFMLEKHFGDAFVYYTMRIKACGDEDTWDDCCLVRRGRAHLNWNPQTPLPKWNSGNADVKRKYDEGIEQFLQRVSATTRRLEGDVEVVKTGPDSLTAVTEATVTPLAVTMLIARGAVKTSANKRRDLLIVVIRSEALLPIGTVPAPDGTGHGDPT